MDFGNIVYEFDVMEGMIVDEGVIVEIVIFGIGNFVVLGEVGEVVVIILNLDYLFICFVIGDMFVVFEG